MTEPWTPHCLVAACDLDRATWPLPVVELHPGQGLDPALLPRLALAISLSPEGAAELDRLDPGLPRQDLAGAEDLPRAVIAALSSALSGAQTRIAKQLREIGQLRQMTERSLQDFQRLEAFVWQSGRGERCPTHDLPPHPDLAFALEDWAEQRLPGSSAGLSDIALWVEGGDGLLTARLSLLESAETLAEWRIEAPDHGWLRLSLPRALGGDAQTAILHLAWKGAPMALGCAFDHPDPRFRCRGGPMLALRLWGFVPGSLAPLAPGAHASSPMRGRWLMGPLALAELDARDGISALSGGLMLVPEPGQELRFPLADLVRPGMRHVAASVSVEGGAELALALAGEAPQWQSLFEPGQVHLALPPIDRPRDLVLHVRAAPVLLDRIEAFSQPMGRDD